MTAERRLEVLPDKQALSERGADEFVRLAAASIAGRGRFDVALSGGSTPRVMHELLSAAPRRDRVDWSRVHLWWGDERHVPPDDPDSNYRMARETLIDRVPVLRANVHRLETELPAHEAAARYDRELRAAFPGAWPTLDLLYLGMGPDAHTLSLFPETAALDDTEHWVVANRVPKLDTWRVTLTAPAANASRQIVFLVAGADKAAALQHVLEGPRDPHRYPSQLIKGALWLVDRDAAAKLD